MTQESEISINKSEVTQERPQPGEILSSMVRAILVTDLLGQADQGTITEDGRQLLRRLLPDEVKPEPKKEFEIFEEKRRMVEELNREMQTVF